jgi:hypothetical protein
MTFGIFPGAFGLAGGIVVVIVSGLREAPQDPSRDRVSSRPARSPRSSRRSACALFALLRRAADRTRNPLSGVSLNLILRRKDGAERRT